MKKRCFSLFPVVKKNEKQRFRLCKKISVNSTTVIKNDIVGRRLSRTKPSWAFLSPPRRGGLGGAFYSFTFLLFYGCVVWARCPYLLLNGYGRNAVASYFLLLYSFTFLLLKYKVTVFSANIGYAYNKEREKLSLNLRHNRKKQ